jgi:hypothetical protein
MENKIINQPNLVEKITYIIKRKKILLLSIGITLFACVAGGLSFNYYKDTQNVKISEKYIKAGIHLSLKDKKKSKEIYKEIVLSKNKFYSLLALNNIIENGLEKDSNEVLFFFEIVENVKNTKEQKDLVKLKKSLYLIKISKAQEANKLLNEIISSNSVWKETALEIIK